MGSLAWVFNTALPHPLIVKYTTAELRGIPAQFYNLQQPDAVPIIIFVCLPLSCV